MRALGHFFLVPVITICLLGCPFVLGQTVVFEQAGFPAIDTGPVSQSTLAAALGGAPIFANVEQLRSGEVLKNATLLVFPYGSAFPADAWPSVLRYVQQGGNLLLLGGQPFRIPVTGDRTFAIELPQDSYARALDFRHSYAVPLGTAKSHFAWRPGYSFLPQLDVSAKEIFAQEGRLQGLGYLDAEDGTHLAAPVIVADRFTGGKTPGSRIVALPFTPTPGYWASPDGVSLVRAAARYAQAGPVNLQIEVQYSTLRPGENPQLTAHLRGPNIAPGSTLDAQLIEDGKTLSHAHLTLTGDAANVSLPLHDPLPAGVYTVRATWTPAADNTPQEFAENGFQVEDLSALAGGDALGVEGDFLTLGGKPFFPVGTNYFTTEENGWDFSDPRNAAVWERDFAEMERHNVSFVRTGVWMGAGSFLDPATGGANERFLRNLEAFLAAAHRHHIAVNFTFFAFTPRVAAGFRPAAAADGPPPPNPYLDAATLNAEKAYIVSVVQRFGKLPWLSYDLINEPSFSNPRNIFHGNVPNGDPAELAAWQAWLQKRYGTLATLAEAWRTTAVDLGDWSSIPLPKPADLKFGRNGNDHQVRAFDYNLFAQNMFSSWVHTMVATIRATGSRQLINVGQDEGGVSDRVLNQFYATAGVSFTTNHTYWLDDALLWDSVVAKRPGMPNITGETCVGSRRRLALRRNDRHRDCGAQVGARLCRGLVWSDAVGLGART